MHDLTNDRRTYVMPIREKSFRIGCGRYLQEPGIIKSLGSEVLRLGKTALIIGGKTALEITGERIEKSLKAAAVEYRIKMHRGTCNDEDAKKFAELAQKEGYDVIVGVGGGVIMDFAKMVSYFATLPIINIPTSSATCAAYTPLSVRYTKEGRTLPSHHHELEVNAVLADTEVILTQPTRLLLSGVFDSIAKFLEIEHRYNENVKDYPLGLDYAYALSVRSYKELYEKTESVIEDMKNKRLSNAAEEVIFTAIAATGVISGIARGSNQCALAHKFYEITRVLFNEEAKPYLHGEIVGVGLLLQNEFSGARERNYELLSLMKKYSMPMRVSDLGITNDQKTLIQYYERLKNTSAIDAENEEECARLLLALKYLWSI